MISPRERAPTTSDHGGGFAGEAPPDPSRRPANAGIYAFEDDLLKICYNESYRPDPADRPTDFDPDPPNGILQMLKRIEPAAEPATDSATEPVGEVGDQ